MLKSAVLISLAWCLAMMPAMAAENIVHHELKVEIKPQQQFLSVQDYIHLPKNRASVLSFSLHSGLKAKASSKQGEVTLTRMTGNKRFNRYQIKLEPSVQQITLSYQGKVFHALQSVYKKQSRGFSSTSGIIDQQGSFLAHSSVWYPQFDDFDYLTFDLKVTQPASWRTVSQGQRVQRNISGAQSVDHWQEKNPQQEIYLIAAEFTEYSRDLKSGKSTQQAQVFLRSADQKLANKYLDATVKYLKLYEKLLGPYPYSKFALVENFWETGFGMPSFTLLGSKVIRLPFILNSSYPHEILHNWWGNGVYVDYTSGNWSEGLTAYLADHLIKQQQGQGAQYRQQSLQKYRDYAANNRDLALSEFRSRHSSATEAVGYGKTLMLFHMLRNKLGDELFTQGLKQFYREYRFKEASFADIERLFSELAGTSLDDYFKQWVERVGAPELALIQAAVKSSGDSYQLEFTLQQLQTGPPYQLDIPVAVSLKGQSGAKMQVLQMSEKKQTFKMELSAKPTRIDVDPAFDLFRKLAVEETPAAFTQLFGAQQLTVVLPNQASDEMRSAWQQFATRMKNMGPEQVSIVWDDEISKLPDEEAVAILGWKNRFAETMQQQLTEAGVAFATDHVKHSVTFTPVNQHAFAWATRYYNKHTNKPVPRAFITADLVSALPGFARKLPHYHKYSYLAFSGDEPQNQLKGRWSIDQSPMTQVFDEASARAQLPKQSALIDAESLFNKQNMMAHVRYLSDPALKGRGFGSEGLKQAANYISQSMLRAGLQPGGDNDSYLQPFSAKGGKNNQSAELFNVVGMIPGRHPVLAKQHLIIGAHYDHLGLGWPDVRADNQGKLHSGADDNASGVAVLLELARVLAKDFQPDRTLIFVAFSGEEAGRLGSKHYVRHEASYPVKNTIGMLNLDTVGRLFDHKLMVLGAESASEWPHIFRGIGFVTGIPSVMVSEALDASDQVSFHEVGVPAVQLFSGPHTDYHRPGDTIDKIDDEGLLSVAEVSRQVIEYLAARPEPMTVKLSGYEAQQGAKKSRKVSLGTIPDFTYQGEGYRLDGVLPNSPAQQSGLQKHDIIKKINDQTINGLRDVSRVLKSLAPGQMITIRFQRDQKVLEAQARLSQR